ncbi:MAG TPA: tetratricopeptide repeat protein [Thermoanaerobaculia bacterium]|nr:tetratricopeptide repeat protein [Thermoanaerobaculia bacterium]
MPCEAQAAQPLPLPPITAAVAASSPAPRSAAATQASDYPYLVAKLLALEGLLPDALAAYEQAETLNPGAAYIHLEHAQLLSHMAQAARLPSAQANLLKQAAEQVSKARRVAPANLDVLRAYGTIHLELASQDPAALEPALGALEEVYRRDPDDVQTALNLGRTLLEQRQTDRAVEIFRALIRRAPQQRAAYALLVEALLRADKGKEAESVLAEILEFEPDSLEARLTLAELQSRRSDHRAALATLKATPEPQRTEPRLRRQLAWAYYLTGDLDGALAMLEPLLAAAPDDSQLALLKGLIFSAQGRNDEAAQLLEKLRGGRAGDPALAMVLARVLERQGRRDEAARVLQDLTAGLAKDGKLEEERQARLELAQVYFEAKDWDRVTEALQPLLGLGSKDNAAREPAVLLAADALIERKSYDQALDLLGVSGGGGSDGQRRSVALASKRAEVLLRAGRGGEAGHQLDDLAALGDPQALLAVAQTYQRVEKYGDSIPVLQRLVASQSGSAPAGFLLGAAYERTGKRAQAVAEFRRVLGLDPDYHAALNYLGYMFAEQGENLTEAQSLVERAVALEPDNGAYVDSLGWVYFRLGRYEQARATLERATHLETGDATVQEHLGDVYGALGQVERAEEAYRRALALGAKDPEKLEQVRRKLDSLGRRP